MGRLTPLFEKYGTKILIGQFRRGLPLLRTRRRRNASGFGFNRGTLTSKIKVPIALQIDRNQWMIFVLTVMNKLVMAKIVGVAFLALTFQAMADPSNFIVGDLTFVRPPSWEWENLEEKDKVEASLLIRDEASHAQSKVIFFLTSTDKDQIAKKWKASFIAPPAVIFRTETKTIGKFEITYLHLKGSFHSPSGKTGSNYELLGAIFRTNKGNLFVRALGDSSIVTRITPEFTKMIEAALLEN